MADLSNNPLMGAGGQLGGAGASPLAGLNINDPELQKKLAEYMMHSASLEPQAQNVNFQKQQAQALRQGGMPRAQTGFGVAQNALQGGMEGYLDKQALQGNQDLARQKFEMWKKMQGNTAAGGGGTPASLQMGGNVTIPMQEGGGY